MRTLTKTDFCFNKCVSVYHGKVRDIYTIRDRKNPKEELLVMIVTDRISAFDVILPFGIPEKGQVLNQIASKFLDATQDIVPNWKISTPDPMVMVGHKAKPIMIEMVVRGYLTGHAWREYKSGKRTICGIAMPDGMVEHQKFENPIITPTTKATEGHDEDISREEIIARGLVSEADYKELEQISLALFERGTQIAASRGLILVDTKYEFGKIDNRIILIDEIHTPDSSRYFYSDGYEERLKNGQQQKQLSKEFVREWLIDNGFEGKEGQEIPFMTDEFINSVSERYIELYERLTGEKYEKDTVVDNLDDRILSNIITICSEPF